MGLQEQMVDILLDAIDSQYINEETIGQFTYNYLAALLEVTKSLDNGAELYLKIKRYLEDINIQRLRKKEKIIVGFIANYSSTWIGDGLYRLLEESDRFEPYVFLISNHNGQSDEMIKEEYIANLAFFKERNLRVIGTLDTESGRQYSWNEMGIKPEVCIWLTPWIDLFRGDFYLLNYSMDTLHTYIPYGFMIAQNETGQFVYDQYNKLIHNLAWKLFEESQIARDMAEKYSFVKGTNAVYTGYPKMDDFYRERSGEKGIWDQLVEKSGNKNAKRIIYAPHHSINEKFTVNFSTFAYNYRVMLELAQKYKKETLWVVKPHPQLKYKAISAGIFKNEQEWNEYIDSWRKLENAEVMEAGAYDQLFWDSDAMILDSVSFLAEYLYVNKPVLLLGRDGQYFNDFGKMLIGIHYKADGRDEIGIEKYITDIVIAEKDANKETREHFFAEKLDYVKASGNLATKNIVNVLESILCV